MASNVNHHLMLRVLENDGTARQGMVHTTADRVNVNLDFDGPVLSALLTYEEAETLGHTLLTTVAEARRAFGKGDD